MCLESAIRRRVITANTPKSLSFSVESIYNTDGGGLKLILEVHEKKFRGPVRLFIPATMRPDLERGARNRALDQKFKLAL